MLDPLESSSRPLFIPSKHRCLDISQDLLLDRIPHNRESRGRLWIPGSWYCKLSCFQLDEMVVKRHVTWTNTRHQRRPQLLTPFLNLHFISLLLITFTALDVISPIRFRTVLPVLPNFDFDAVHVCQDIDAAYGADPVWLETCSSSFEVVKTAVGWTCLVLTAGQWWFIRAVCILKKKLEERNMSRGRRRDVEMEYDVNKR